ERVDREKLEALEGGPELFRTCDLHQRAADDPDRFGSTQGHSAEVAQPAEQGRNEAQGVEVVQLVERAVPDVRVERRGAIRVEHRLVRGLCRGDRRSTLEMLRAVRVRRAPQETRAAAREYVVAVARDAV